MEDQINNETKASDGGERRLPSDLSTRIAKILSQFPEEKKPKVIVVGQDNSLLNNAAMLAFSKQGLDVLVVTPAEAKLLDDEIEKDRSDTIKITKEIEPFVLHAPEKFLERPILNEKHSVNPDSRGYKRRGF